MPRAVDCLIVGDAAPAFACEAPRFVGLVTDGWAWLARR
jgi:hypothetical protein